MEVVTQLSLGIFSSAIIIKLFSCSVTEATFTEKPPLFLSPIATNTTTEVSKLIFGNGGFFMKLEYASFHIS